jgi:putative flippase GtrA
MSNKHGYPRRDDGEALWSKDDWLMHWQAYAKTSFSFKKISRYLLIGGLTFIIYYAFLWICFSFAGLPYFGAVAIAYAIAITFHFLAHRRITFNAGGSKVRHQIVRYLFVALLNYFIQLGVIRLCYEMYNINFYISAFFGVMSTLITGYFLMNFWVFKSENCDRTLLLNIKTPYPSPRQFFQSKSINIVVIIFLMIFSLYVGLTRFEYSQGEDMGIWLSVFGFVAKGVPLYSGVFDNKDPLFLLSGAYLVNQFGAEAPFLLDVLLFIVVAPVAYRASCAFGFDRFTSFAGAVILVLTLSGGFYSGLRSTLFAAVLIILALFAATRGYAVIAGIIVAVVGGFKMPYLMLCLPIIPLIYEQGKSYKAISRVVLGFIIGGSSIIILLIVRGEFNSYLSLIRENFFYQSDYMKALGRTEGIKGNLETIASMGINIQSFIIVIVIAVCTNLLNPSGVSRLNILALGFMSGLVLVYLAMSGMWPHHFQVLALYIWPLSILLIGFLQTYLHPNPFLWTQRSIAGRLLRAIAFSLSVFALFVGLNGSRVFFTNKSKVPLTEVFHHKWQIAPEIAALNTAYTINGGEKTFARLGANDDSGFGMFIENKWDLSCARFWQDGHEPMEIMKNTLRCFETKPNYVIASPVFFSLQRYAGSFNKFRDDMLLILKQNFDCASVQDWDHAMVCVRRKKV